MTSQNTGFTSSHRLTWLPPDTCELSSPVEAQVPLANQVGGVAGFAEPLGQSVHVRGQAAGLTRPDDGMLKPRVDLISEDEKTDEVTICVFSLNVNVKKGLRLPKHCLNRTEM